MLKVMMGSSGSPYGMRPQPATTTARLLPWNVVQLQLQVSGVHVALLHGM
jgi:hypothetical protein